MSEVQKILDKLNFKLEPIEIGGAKFADKIVITGKKKAEQALYDLLMESLTKNKYTNIMASGDTEQVVSVSDSVSTINELFGRTE